VVQAAVGTAVVEAVPANTSTKQLARSRRAIILSSSDPEEEVQRARTCAEAPEAIQLSTDSPQKAEEVEDQTTCSPETTEDPEEEARAA